MTAFERRVAGDALQLAGLVRDHGPETLHRLMDLWGPDHTRAVCIALAAAVDQDRTPTELWGWLGGKPGQIPTTVTTNRLFRSDPVTNELDKAAVDMRAVDPRSKQQRDYRRRVKASAAGSGGEADPAAGLKRVGTAPGEGDAA